MPNLKNLKPNQWFLNRFFLMALYAILPLIVFLKFIHKGPAGYNNYLIFKYQFIHAWQQLPMYKAYAEYNDITHYGPLFSAVIAPFALLPDFVAMLLFLGGSSAILFYAIRKLSLTDRQHAVIMLVIAHELLTSLYNIQTNPFMASIIVLSFILIEKEKDFWAMALIVLGTFIKLYGIVGLAFFFFSKDKKKFILSGIFWAVVAFVLPMIFSSPSYIIQSYFDWFAGLMEKNAINANDFGTDICVMGMARHIFNDPTISNLLFVIPGIVLFALPYVRINQYKHLAFRMSFLASALMFLVLFSSGSESPTYIIALVGVAIWYVYQPKPLIFWQHSLLGFVLILTTLSASDLFPKYLFVHLVKPYSLKALPVFLVWLTLIYEMMRNDYSKYRTLEKPLIIK